MERANVRGSNYTERENCVIEKGWVRVPENSNTGSEQKGNTFQKRVWEDYKRDKGKKFPIRPLKSVAVRDKTIVREFVQFGAFFATAKAAKPTGVNEDDLIKIATWLSNGKSYSSAG